jgi:hypothetical protein
MRPAQVGIKSSWSLTTGSVEALVAGVGRTKLEFGCLVKPYRMAAASGALPFSARVKSD